MIQRNCVNIACVINVYACGAYTKLHMLRDTLTNYLDNT